MDADAYQQIEQYLSGDLSASEASDFEKRLTNDAELAAAFRAYKEITDSLQAKSDRQEQEAALQATLGTVSREFFESKEKSGKTISMQRVYWAAAASLLLIVSFIFILQRSSTPAYDDYSHEPLVLASRSAATDSIRQKAEVAFNNKAYEKAADALEQLVATTPDDPQLAIYLAIANIETADYQTSDSLLVAVAEGQSIYVDKASWYLALSYLKQGKKAACKAQLMRISETSPYYEKAQELLDEL